LLHEDDALHVVHALRKEEKNSCIYGQLIDDARVMLNSLQNKKVTHVIRKVNGEVHRLAKEALSLMGK
jgi:hypothetical protein